MLLSILTAATATPVSSLVPVASIASDIQKLDPGTLIDVFTLDATAQGGEVFNFHAGVNELGNDVVWQGKTYTRYPVIAEGFELKATGTAPRPKIRASNVGGVLGRAVNTHDDLIGAKVTRKRTFLRYLDAENFAKDNFVLWSEDLSKSTWNKVLSAVQGGFGDAHGETRAWLLRCDSTLANTHYVDQYVNTPTLGTNVFTFAIDVKSAGLNRIDFRTYSRPTTAIYVRATFDCDSKSFVNYHEVGGAVMLAKGFEDLGDGWSRVWMTVSYGTADAQVFFRVGLVANGASSMGNFDGDGSSGVLIAHPQISLSDKLVEYKPTAATTNPSADPNVSFSDDVYFVDRKVTENKVMIEWELVSAMDLAGVKLPNRQIIANVCPWKYRGPECNYTGGPVADYADTPTTDPDYDNCGHRLSSCRLRFDKTNSGDGILRFGGFPAAGLLRA